MRSPCLRANTVLAWISLVLQGLLAEVVSLLEVQKATVSDSPASPSLLLHTIQLDFSRV